MDYKQKYIKYKSKYLQHKNIKGGEFKILEDLITNKKINNIAVTNYHGSLAFDNKIIVPDNIYLIQSNVCGISNYESLISLITQDDIILPNLDIIKKIKETTNYVLVLPNTEICDINLSTYYTLNKENGFLELQNDIKLFDFYFARKTIHQIKTTLNNFDITTLDNTKLFAGINSYYVLLLNNVNVYNFIILTFYTTLLIPQTDPKYASIYELGQYVNLHQFVINIFNGMQLPTIITDMTTQLAIKLDELKDDSFFELLKDYYNYIIDNNYLNQTNIINLFDNIKLSYNGYNEITQETVILLLDHISLCIKTKINRFINSHQPITKTLLHTIFTHFIIMFFGNGRENTKLSTLLNDYSKKIKPGEKAIVFSISCLSAYPQSKDEEEKILICQNKISKVTDVKYNEIKLILDIMNKNLFNNKILSEKILFNDIDTYYDTALLLDDNFKLEMDNINRIFSNALNDDEKKFIRNYINLCLSFDYLFNNNNEIILHKNNILYAKDIFDKRFTNNKFYRLLYYIYKTQQKLQGIFKKYLDYADKPDEPLIPRQILFKNPSYDSMNTLYEAYDRSFKYNILLLEEILEDIKLLYETLDINKFIISFALINRLNYYYINLILDNTKILNKKSNVIFKVMKEDSGDKTFRVYLLLKDEYKNDKIKDKEIILTLTILDFNYLIYDDIQTLTLINNNIQDKTKFIKIQDINKSYYITNSAQYITLLQALINTYLDNI